MDYYKIGQKIRKVRKAHELSQEKLAEMVGVSVTHMSHIETGNTKLSLQVLVDIAESLEVSTDYLLFDKETSVSQYNAEIAEILQNCSAKETKIVYDVIKALKTSLAINA